MRKFCSTDTAAACSLFQHFFVLCSRDGNGVELKHNNINTSGGRIYMYDTIEGIFL